MKRYIYIFHKYPYLSSPVPGAPKTGTVSPNSPTGETDPKKKIYIAKEQRYCLEFRLSEETVDNYNNTGSTSSYSYVYVRDLYTGDNGTYSGWMVFREWLISEGFSSGWTDEYIAPSKSKSDALYTGVQAIALAGFTCRPLLFGAVPGRDGWAHGNGRGGDCKCGLWYIEENKWVINDAPWSSSDPSYILFVRPL